MQLGGTINDKKKTGRPISWTSARKNRLKRLADNRKGVTQQRLGRKLSISHVTICRQLSQMNISCYKREKTPEYNEKQTERAKNLGQNLPTYNLHTKKKNVSPFNLKPKFPFVMELSLMAIFFTHVTACVRV